MGQVAHVEVGQTPTDVGQGLTAGCYRAQVFATRFGLVALVAYGPGAPADRADWFRVEHGAFFDFRAGTGVDPCWVVSDSDHPVRVARRRVT